MRDTPGLLLVDDEDGIRLVMAVLLRDMGYAVTTAARGDEALALYKERKPDIVISDIKMPGKDGIALLREIKALDPDAEVLLLTGHGDMDLAVAGLRHGAGDFLNKPASDAALEVALERAKKRIALREALRRHTEELEDLVARRTADLIRSERFAAVGESAAALAHAIKNIAGALEGTMFVLEKGLELNKREYFEQGWQMIRGDVSRLHNLAVGLLDLGRPPMLVRRAAPPAAPALQVCESLAARAREAGVRLECIDETNGEPFVMPSEDVYQCLLNLAVNAIEACAGTEAYSGSTPQAMPETAASAPGMEAAANLNASPATGAAGAGVTTTTATSATDAGATESPNGPRVGIIVKCECLENGVPCIAWHVRDNGPGMGAATEGNVKPGAAFHTRKAGGSGIGLFATRRTAREMGAELEFSSPDDGGTLAVLRLCGGEDNA